MAISVDLTTLSGWSGVTAGSHSLTIVAKATGYTDSDPSTGVSFSIYSITATPTNVTASASNPTTIVTGGTATLNFTADGTSYKMPTSITVGSTTVPAGTETTVSGVATFLYTRTSDTAGSVAISNPTSNVSFTVVGESQQTYPVKGQLITMTLGNATPAAGTQDQYRVLSINGSIAEVVAMYDISTSQQFRSSTSEGNAYEGSLLDTALNTTWYATLNSTAQAAIAVKTLTQYQYTYNSSVYNATTHASYADYSTKAVKASGLTKRVYALDVEDIETYFNSTFSTANIWTLFWNTTSAPSTITYPWLRSARADSSGNAWYVDGYNGIVYDRNVNNRSAARPAFTIDLSKISWS